MSNQLCQKIQFYRLLFQASLQMYDMPLTQNGFNLYQYNSMQLYVCNVYPFLFSSNCILGYKLGTCSIAVIKWLTPYTVAEIRIRDLLFFWIRRWPLHHACCCFWTSIVYAQGRYTCSPDQMEFWSYLKICEHAALWIISSRWTEQRLKVNFLT
jgi:hypothetical protein